MKRFSLWNTVVHTFLIPSSLVMGEEPTGALLDQIKGIDGVRPSAYTLKVSINEPAHISFLDQGSSLFTCVIVQNETLLAAKCIAEQIPTPNYHPVGSFNTHSRDYDEQGRLGVPIRTKWLALRTEVINESYEEHRAYYVSLQGTVTDEGPIRTIHRYAPDDQGGWALSKLRRIWWALGQGLSSDLEALIETDFSSENIKRFKVRGKVDGFPGGVWHLVPFPTRFYDFRLA